MLSEPGKKANHLKRWTAARCLFVLQFSRLGCHRSLLSPPSIDSARPAIGCRSGRGGGIRTPTLGFGDRWSTVEPTPLYPEREPLAPAKGYPEPFFRFRSALRLPQARQPNSISFSGSSLSTQLLSREPRTDL